MYIDRVPNRNSPPAILLRRCWREGKKIKKETLANMTKWPKALVDVVGRAIKGDQMVDVDDVFAIERSVPYGNVQAVLRMVKRLGIESLIGAKRSRNRDLIVALIAERLLHPGSKLATVRLWKQSTLAAELGVEDATVNEVYAAMVWLNKRQDRIEKKLAQRHLRQGATVLYDVSGSYCWGRTCPLVSFGYSRDKRADRPQIVYGLMTDEQGRPVSVQVYSGNTGDPTTVAEQVEKLRTRFELDRAVLIGDRGMLTQARIEGIKEFEELGWISALRNDAIRKLVEADSIQLTLFDEKNLAEITSPLYPGERLIVCRNPELAQERRRKRIELLGATEQALGRIEAEVKRRTKKPLSAAEIGMKVGRVIGRRKMKKHFRIDIADGRIQWTRNEKSIRQEQALDGIYVVRTSEPKHLRSAARVVRDYKSLALVEHAFRSFKGIDLRIRPIRHRLEETVRAHVFICMLGYYVQWHMRKALSPLLFDDEELETDRNSRDPVAKAQPSASAKQKKKTKKNTEGFDVHSFETLLAAMATQTKNTCRAKNANGNHRVDLVAEATPMQAKAFDLLEAYPVTGTSKWP
jgi:transposase